MIATKRDKPVALSEANNELLALNWDGGNEAFRVSDFPEVFAAERFAVPQSELKPGGWQLEPPVKRRLLERLRKAGQPLGEYCKGRFYYGIKTGLNEAFVITREQRDALVAQDPQSAEIIKPFLRGRDVKRWNVEFEEQYLIKIESSENATHPWSGLPTDKAEKKFAKMHPSIYAWFTSEDRRQQLIDRTDQGRFFWELRSCAYWDLFAAPKIIYPDIYLHQSLAWDEAGLYCANTAYFIPNAEKWLTAVLNSAAIEWFYDQISTRMQGGYLRAFTDKMKALPIPNSTEEQRQMIENCVDAVRMSISRSEYERLLSGLVYELFFPEDLHAKNIRLFDACAAAGIRENMDAQAVAARIFRNDHPIYGQLFDLRALDVVRIIESVE